MDLAAARTHAQGILLDKTVTLNGIDVPAHVIKQGRDEDGDSVFDYIEVEFTLADYPAVTYRTDTLVYNGTTLRYPRQVSVDGARTRTVRFIYNQRPIHGRRGR